ncbi:MAG TPA: hypothetical protein VKB50_03920 [Vicinamibacterales bacterium]|nr:hypothetical protein [Vicinamibacterales bacterium]
MRSTAVVFLIVLSSATRLAAQSPQERLLFESYLQSIRAYQHDDFDRRSPGIAELSKGDFYKIRPLLQREEPRVIQTAALLHTEVALSATDAERVDLQLAYAEAALNLLPRGLADTPAFRTRWYRVVSTMYLARRDPEAARPFLERGLRSFPDDARLHLLSGIAYEITAQVHAINCVDQACTTRARRLDLLKWTGFAAADYRKASQLDARLFEAQLRLGRVMAVSDNEREARSLLEMAVNNATDMRHRYLAALFLAALDTDAEDFQNARSRYETATRLCPWCQSAYVGLSFVGGVTGQAAAASSAIEQLFEKRALEEVDPWVEYQFPQLDTETLDGMRAQVRR